jgi:choline transport protein
MVSACIVFLQTSCVIPQAIVLYRGRSRVLPPRHFDLGRLGVPINAVAVTWVVFLDILYCFPTSVNPVTPQNMSYVSVVAAGLIVFVVSLWFTTKRGVFVGPKIDWDLLVARRNAAIQQDGDEVVVVGVEKTSTAGTGLAYSEETAERRVKDVQRVG